MSDETKAVSQAGRDAAVAALDRAHLAAAAADGGKLRRALEDAADSLDALPAFTGPAGKVRAALADLDSGALAELEVLLEEARKSVAAA